MGSRPEIRLSEGDITLDIVRGAVAIGYGRTASCAIASRVIASTLTFESRISRLTPKARLAPKAAFHD